MLNVSVVVTENGAQRDYSTTLELKGSKVWQKVQIDLASLKSAERMGIKGFEDIIAVKIEAESRFAVNNLLLI